MNPFIERHEMRADAQRLAKQAGLQIEFIRKYKGFRKEQRIKTLVAERGTHPGLAHIFSAMVQCASYCPWNDKATGRARLKPKSAKYLYYYFYLTDELFGLCYLRLPTWAPFRQQVYFNGHNRLAARLDEAGVGYRMSENAFRSITGPEPA